MSRPLVIVDVVSDILCPFCWIGKRAMEQAIGMRSGKIDVEIRWHPFFLRRGVPREGIDKLQAYTQKFGRDRAEYFLLSPESPVKVHGKRYGLEFNYKPGCVVGDSMPGHRLLMYTLEAHGSAIQNKLMEGIFRRFFKECENIGAPQTLISAALEAGLTEAEAKAVIDSDKYLKEVTACDVQNNARGISGVPNFEIYISTAPGNKAHTSGAQDPEYFASLLDRVAKQ